MKEKEKKEKEIGIKRVGRGSVGRLVQGPRCQRQNGADISEHLGRGTRIPPAFRGRKTPNRGKADMAARSSSSATVVDASRIWPSHLFLDS